MKNNCGRLCWDCEHHKRKLIHECRQMFYTSLCELDQAIRIHQGQEQCDYYRAKDDDEWVAEAA
jgi:hypothetical protein